MVDIRQTAAYASYLARIGWKVERLAEINYFIKRIPLLGSVLKIQRPEEIRIDKIRDLAKKYRAFQIIVEPKTKMDANYLISSGFKLSKSPYLPTKTMILDLTVSGPRLLAKMKKDARSAIRKSANLKTEEATRIEDFRSEWKKAVGLKRYVPALSHLRALKKSFKQNGVFYFCLDENQKVLAGAVFLVADNLGYYWQAFTNEEGRKALAQYKTLWEGILWAKKKGAKVFDFEGVYDERFPNKSWLGFTHFKKSFGGGVLEYPGAYTLSRLPL